MGQHVFPEDRPDVVLLSDVDLPDVLALEKTCFVKTWSLEQLQASFRQGLILLGAKSLERLVGYVGFQIVVPDMELLNVAVLPAWRGRGLGRDLVQAALVLGLKQGAKFCFLEVAADNAPALSLYQSLGFAITGLRRNYFQEKDRSSESVDALMMRKELRKEMERLGDDLEGKVS
jgi:ribosomal-protein-alanine N-acetyltransferase